MRPTSFIYLSSVAILAGLVHGIPGGVREITLTGNQPNNTSAWRNSTSSTSSSFASSSSALIDHFSTTVASPSNLASPLGTLTTDSLSSSTPGSFLQTSIPLNTAGNVTLPSGSGTAGPPPLSSPASSSKASALPDFPAHSPHIALHTSSGGYRFSGFSNFRSLTGNHGPGLSRVMSYGGSSSSALASGHFSAGGVGFGSATGSGVSKPGLLPPTGTNPKFPQNTGFSQLQKFPKLSAGVSGSTFGTAYGSAISGGYVSAEYGSLGGWARNPSCTASWNSRFSAANGTVMTTKRYSYTVILTDNTVTTLSPGDAITRPTTKTYNAGTSTYRVDSDEVCCGNCNVLYPNVRVYYWPLNDTNTRCAAAGDSGVLNPEPPDFSKLGNLPNIKPRDADAPMITPPPKMFRQSAPGMRELEARNFVPLSNPGIDSQLPKRALSGSAHPLPLPGLSNLTLDDSNSSQGLHEEVIDIVHGMTFISPTVYVVISTIQATDKCGGVGGVHTSLTLSYAQTELSTVDASGQTGFFNPMDLPCPSAALGQSDIEDRPRIVAPHTALQGIDNAWQSCQIVNVGQGYDAPSPLTPQMVMVSPTPIAGLPMCSDGSKPDPKLLYVENTESHCLIRATISTDFYGKKAPGYLTQESFGFGASGIGEVVNEGPGYKTRVSLATEMFASHPLAETSPTSVAAIPAQNSPVFVSPLRQPNGDNPASAFDSPAVGLISISSTGPIAAGSGFVEPTGNGLVSPSPSDAASALVPPNDPPGSQPTQQQKGPRPTPNSVLVAGQTVAEGQPSVNIGGQSVALSGGNVIVGSLTASAPVQPVAPATSPAIVAAGLTMTPQNSNAPAAPAVSPVAVAGLIFSAPPATNAPGPNPQAAAWPDPTPVVAGRITYQPIPFRTPITVGGLTFNPVPSTGANSPQQHQAPEIGAPGQTGSANIVVGGQTYYPKVTAEPANGPVIENGVTMAPVVAGNPALTPLGVVGGQIVSGSSSQAVVAGQTLSVGGPPVTVLGTPVSLGSSHIVIGSSTAALPIPTRSALATVAGQVISGGSSQAVVAGQTISAGGPPITISGTSVSLGSSSIAIGDSTALLPTIEPSALGVVGGQVINGDSSSAVVAGQTISAGGPPVTIQGTPVSLGSSVIVIGTNAVLLPSEIQSAGPSAFSIAGTTVSSGGAPITVSGMRISLGASGLVVGSSTVPLTSPVQFTSATGGLQVFNISGTEVTEGGPAVTVSGTRISVDPSALFIGSSTIALPSTSAFSVGGQVFTPQAGGFSIDGTTITPGGPGVTISGTQVSLAPGSELVLGPSTIALPVGPTGSPTLQVAGQTLTAIPQSLGNGYVVDGQTITPGASTLTISGTPISLNPSFSLVIGSSTIALATAGSETSNDDANSPLTAAGETFTPLNPTAVAIDGTTLSLSGAALTDHGTVITLASAGLIVGFSTFAFPTPLSNDLTSVTNGPIPGQATPSIFTIDGETFTAEPSGLSIAGTDITFGGSPLTLNGTIIALDTSALTVGASTISIANVSGLATAIASASVSASVSATAITTAAAAPTLLGPAGPKPTGGRESNAVGRMEVMGEWGWMVGMAVVAGDVAWFSLI